MSSLNLKYEATYKDIVKIPEILRAYLQPNSETSINDAANSILALFPANETAYSKSTFGFAELLIETAEQIPYNHPSHLKLATLLKLLSRSPKFLGTTLSKTNETLYHPFQALSERFMDYEPGPCTEEEGMPWVSFHAFLAQLEATGMWQESSIRFALMELSDAFEKEPENDWETKYHVMAAAQWIFWYGQNLFKEFLFQLPGTDSIKPGDLYSASGPSVPTDRWMFWMKGFASVKEKAYGDECKAIASKAYNLMDAMLKNMT